ncbi:MAG: DUF1858 domain-containing protein [Nanoarchaeota archaeon]
MTKQESGGITKDMAIAEIVEKYPEVIETLLSTGVHCIGCHVSHFETLEQGLKGHGHNDEFVTELVSELNNIIYKK